MALTDQLTSQEQNKDLENHDAVFFHGAVGEFIEIINKGGNYTVQKFNDHQRWC